MNSNEIRSRFIAFFERRGHAVIPSASLVPENDPSVLFTTAGMQPLVPYLLGEPHPKGKRLVNVQKCVRTQDIEEVGDKTHDTFFEMMGNWSLGDYFKDEAIGWSYDLLTSKEEGFGLDLKRLYVTVFEGNENAPKDTESFEIWKKLGVPEHRIYFLSEKSNWWSAGDNGPCGPDTEMFYDITPSGLGDLTLEQFLAEDEKQNIVEVWNDVFMEYLKKDGTVIQKLNTRNVDTGSGLERIAMVLQKKESVFETDLFSPIMSKIKEQSTRGGLRAERIVADHIRTSVMLIADGVKPSNSDQGYILRRLLRRSVRYADTLGMEQGSLPAIAIAAASIYEGVYGEVQKNIEKITSVITEEEEKFRNTLKAGLKEFERIGSKPISGEDAFILFSTYGFPLEMTIELANERNLSVDIEGFKAHFSKHQEVSKVGAEEKFKGGLADTSEQTIKYHTATHLLHQALRDVLGNEVRQRGSNITAERLRFDFEYGSKLTDEQKEAVERIVNEKIKANLPVHSVVLPFVEAEKTGALHFFGDKYGDEVSVYYIGGSIDTSYSKEFCGGPHVKETGSLGEFKIIKEEAVSAGVRRIKAKLV